MVHLIDVKPHSSNIFNTSYFIRVHCTFTVTAVRYREHPTQVTHRPNIFWFTPRKAPTFLDSWSACFAFWQLSHHTQVQTEGLALQEQEVETSLDAESSSWAHRCVCVWMCFTAVGKRFTFDCSLVGRRGSSTIVCISRKKSEVLHWRLATVRWRWTWTILNSIEENLTLSLIGHCQENMVRCTHERIFQLLQFFY